MPDIRQGGIRRRRRPPTGRGVNAQLGKRPTLRVAKGSAIRAANSSQRAPKASYIRLATGSQQVARGSTLRVKKGSVAHARKGSVMRGSKIRSKTLTLHVIEQGDPRPKPIRPKENERVAFKNGRATYMKILAFLFFLLVFVYIGFYVKSLISREKLPETRVVMGNVETAPIYRALIIRDEEVYKSPVEGMVDYKVSDSELVKPGATVCLIKDPQTTKSYEDSLEEIDSKIIDLQQTRQEFSLFKQDIDRANARIKTIVENGAYRLKSSISNVYSIKNRMTEQLTIRNNMMLSENRGSVSQLVGQRESASQDLDSSISAISVDEGGVVLFNVDGLEEQLTPNAMHTLTRAQTESNPEPSPKDASAPIKAGEAAFKVIRSNIWNAVCYIPKDDIEFSTGSDLSVYIKSSDGDSYSIYDAVVESVAEPDTFGYRMTVLTFNKYVLEFASQRSFEFKLFENSEQGLKIPNDAIVEKTFLVIPKRYVEVVEANQFADEAEAVYIYDGENRSPRAELISVSYEDSALVKIVQEMSVIKLGDVLVDPRDKTSMYTISDIEKARGVYVTNTGVPVFKPLDFTDIINSNELYTVFDPAKNKGLRNNDHIISDVSQLLE